MSFQLDFDTCIDLYYTSACYTMFGYRFYFKFGSNAANEGLLLETCVQHTVISKINRTLLYSIFDTLGPQVLELGRQAIQ